MYLMVLFTGIIALVAAGHAAHYSWHKAVAHYNTVDAQMWKVLLPCFIAFCASLVAAFIFFYLLFMTALGFTGYLGISCWPLGTG